MMVGLGNLQPVSTSSCRKNIYPNPEHEDEVDANAERESRSDIESEAGRSSEISSVDSSITFEKERKCHEALQALVSAASKDQESVHLSLNGRGTLGQVICATKREIMRIDDTIETLTSSAGNLTSSGSEAKQVVSDEEKGHCNATVEDKKTESILETRSEAEDAVGPSVENFPTDNEVVERMLVAKQSLSIDGFVKELVNVEGYMEEPWGSAVEVGNDDFYPTSLTRALEEDEFKRFLQESEDEENESEKQEFHSCVETQSESGSRNTSSVLVDEQHTEDVLKSINQPECVTSRPEIAGPEEEPLSRILIMDRNENSSEIKSIRPKSLDSEDSPHETKSNGLEIPDSEESVHEIKSNRPEITDSEETLHETKSTRLVIPDSEENLFRTKSTGFEITTPEGRLPGRISTDLDIADLEEKLPESISNVHESVTTEEISTEKDVCDQTDPVLPETSGDALLNTEFSKLEEIITDDYILDVFINDVEGQLLDNDLNLEINTESASVESPATEGLDVTVDSKVQEKEQIAEDLSCLNLDTKMDIVQRNDDDSATVPTNDEKTEHVPIQDARVIEIEKDETPFEKCTQNIDSSKDSPMSSESSSRGRARDPKIHRRTRSFEPLEDAASQVSVASTSSSHSSVRACSVILTRVDASRSPSQSPVRSKVKTKPVTVASPLGKSNSIATETQEQDQSKVEPDSDGCNEKDENISLAAPNSMSEKSSEDAAKLTLPSDPSTTDATSNAGEDDVNIEDEPIRLYEPINLDDTSNGVEDENSSNKTDVMMEAAPDLPDEPVRATRKRKSSAKALETEAKKVRPSSMKRVSTEKPMSSMSKREIIAYVKKESKKAQPDFIKLSEAMDITYDPTRKAMYDNGQVDVEIIKKKHPELLHYQMVKGELGRILKDPTKMVRLEKELSEEVLSSALEGKKKTSFPSKKRHPLWQKAIKLWGEKKGSENSTQYQRVLGMLAVCFEFAENAVVNKLCTILKQNGTLSENDTEKMDTPTIVVKESELFSVGEEADIWIYVDGEKYIKVPNMYEAVLSVFAAYYIFNISYDKSLKSLFEFFDYLCDNRQSTYKASAKKWPPELRYGVKEFPVLNP